MKTPVLFSTVLIVMLVFVASTNARPNTRKSGQAYDEDGEAEIGYEERDIGRGRRTRHSRQTFNGYSSHTRSYLFEESTLLFHEKLLFELKKISESLDRLSSRPPTQQLPTLIATPYSYPWPVLPMKCENNSVIPGIRISDVPIWPSGGDNNEDTADDDDDDGSRPISFKPVSVKVPAPPVEHGSVQAEVSTLYYF